MVNSSELRHRKLGKKNLPPNVKTQVKNEKPSKSCFPLMLFAFITSVAAIMVIGYLISPIKAEVFKDVQHVPLTGVFAVNEKLSKGVRITGLPGPESIVEGLGGKLYTGLAEGRIVCIHPSSDGEIGAGKVENITTGIIQGAVMSSDALGHGRPLGLRVIANTLYVMDSIYGLYTVDLITKSTDLLIAPDAVTPIMKFPNDLTLSADGQTLYFTVVSSLDGITDVAHTIFRGDCTSRVFKYDLSTRKLTLVLENLCTANGIQLTEDETSVIVCEVFFYKCRWFDTKTWKEKYVLHVSVMPDNVRMSNYGTYWIAGASTTRLPDFISSISRSVPFFRQAFLGLLPKDIVMLFFTIITDTSHTMVIEVNDKAEVLNVWHDTSDLSACVSQATHLSDGRIALGSYFAPYVVISDRID